MIEPMICYLDHSYVPADKCWYDFDKNVVLVQHDNVYAFIFSTYGIDHVDIGTACFIAQLKLAQFVDNLADTIGRENERREATRDARIKSICAGVGSEVIYSILQRQYDNFILRVLEVDFFKNIR